MPLPRPPVTSMTDFVVFAFVSLVAIMLGSAMIGVMAVSIFTDRDVSALLGTLIDIATSLIGALIGFVAGTGAGKAQAQAAELDRHPPPP